LKRTIFAASPFAMSLAMERRWASSQECHAVRSGSRVAGS
jgi:hypothetical protein